MPSLPPLCRFLRPASIPWLLLAALLGLASAPAAGQGRAPLPDTARIYTNTLGMRLVRIEPGAFVMGSEAGDLDEAPAHVVEITQPYYVGAFEVTNAQYERFDPGHRALRGKLGFSSRDDEAAVFVSWHDAVAFTRWLSAKEGLPYRLPTEAEWEYAARAGTTTPYHTGAELPAAYLKNPRHSWHPDRDRPHPDDLVPLTVGQAPPNAWGLYDVHGNVAEWTLDWYGPYELGGRKDPVGRTDGDFKVTRGGSHSTPPFYLRSANRMGTLPEDRHWLLGFRVVLGPMPGTAPLPVPPETALYGQGVRQDVPPGVAQPATAEPFFRGPMPYVKLNPTERGPFFYHNHQVDLTETPNGDLLAIWYTTKSEDGRYLAQAASRLRYGSTSWDPASIFWDVPDRNDHGNALWWDGGSTLYHYSGLSAAGTWGNLALIQRTSTDNGATWSRARLIDPEHGLRNQVISSVIGTREGYIVVAADAVSVDNGGTAVHVSRDGGRTWTDPGGTIAGIHASVVQLRDGRLLALGRGDDIDGRMPMSLSDDLGRTWTYRASPFPPIASTQRLVLLRLQEGPLFFASFADNMTFPEAGGGTRQGSGLFAALSFDEGETWPVRRLITREAPPAWVGTARSRSFLMSPHTGEPRGYLAGTQARDGTIHLLSSLNHYAFNLAWLQALPPPAPEASLPVKDDLAVVYGAEDVMAAQDGLQLAHRDGRIEAAAGARPGVRLATQADGQVQWHLTDAFAAADSGRGATAEIALQVRSATEASRGVDLLMHLGGRRAYHLTVTPDAVYRYDGFGYIPVARGLDNARGVHRFRLAAGTDGLVHLFRDGVHLGRWSPFVYRDPDAPGAGPYLRWGAGPGVEATLEHVAFDLSGAFRPPAE